MKTAQTEYIVYNYYHFINVERTTYIIIIFVIILFVKIIYSFHPKLLIKSFQPASRAFTTVVYNTISIAKPLFYGIPSFKSFNANNEL